MSSVAPDNSLPSELLLTILDYLEYDDLYQLTSVSSRFNRLALIVYFAKRNVDISPSGQIDLPNPRKTAEMLSYIRKAPFITSIKRFHCGLFQPDKSFLERVSHLIAILRNVESVEEFAIDFYAASGQWTPALMKQVNSGNALVNALDDLFTAAARVSRSVAIRNGTALRGVLQKVDTSPRRRKGSFLSRLFTSEKLSKQIKHSTSPATHTPRRFAFSEERGAICALEVNSIILLSLPFLNWTIHTLNTHNITRLAFGTIESSGVDWFTLLPQLQIPCLKNLAFHGYTPFYPLLGFVGRHQGITTLAIEQFNMDHPVDDPSDHIARAFRNVTELSSCLLGLAILLTLSGKPFPKLRTIFALWNIGIGQQLKMSVIGEALAPVAYKLGVYPRVVFNIRYRTEVGVTWRLPVYLSPRISGSPTPIDPRLFTAFQLNHVATNLSSNAINAATGTANAFNYFTEAQLDLTPRADKEGIPDLIRSLARSLTNINRFALNTKARDSRPLQENEFFKLYVVHHVLKRFTHLRAVCVDGVSSKIVEHQGEHGSTVISVSSA